MSPPSTDTSAAAVSMPSASMRELFTFADKLDMLLFVIGAVAALGTGTLQPLSIILFADILDEVGQTATGQQLEFGPVLEISLNIIYLGIGAQFGGWIYGFAFDFSKERQCLRFRKKFVWAVLRQDVGWHDVSNPQELPSLIGTSLKFIEEGLSASTWQIFEFVGMAVSGIVISMVYGWDVSLVMLCTSPLVIFSGWLLSHVERVSTAKIQKGYAAAGGIASEALFAIRTVVSFGLETKVCERYEARLYPARAAAVKKSYLKGLADSLLFSSGNWMMAIGMLYAGGMVALEVSRSAVTWSVPWRWLGFGVEQVAYCATSCDPYNVLAVAQPDFNFSAGNVSMACDESTLYVTCATSKTLEDADNSTVEDFFFGRNGFGNGILQNATFSSYLNRVADHVSDFISFFSPDYVGCGRSAANALIGIFGLVQGAQGLGFIGAPLSQMAKARRAMYSVLSTIRRDPPIDAFSDAGLQPKDVVGEINVADLTFAYPSSPDHVVYSGYSLFIPAGKVCALCGPSGSGKSTLVALLERFYDPSGGVIYLDGIDIKTLNVRWLRRQMGYVGQEPVLFSGTVAENVRYGKAGASREEVEAATRAADAHDFITSLPEGYSTRVGSGGGRLSGGQKQRVAIARALVRQPAVMLLDEATSALDSQSEKEVQAALDELMACRQLTTVVIAHRLSTIRNADKIAVVKSGRVAEVGTHEELMELGELYARLVSTQLGAM